jgi:hypothetical protein
MKLTKSKLKQVIMEGIFDTDTGDSRLAGAMEELLDGIKGLDTSVDYLSSIMSGEDPLTMQYGQRAFGRMKRPAVRPSQPPPQQPQLKEAEEASIWKTHIQEAIMSLYGAGYKSEDIRGMVEGTFGVVMNEIIDEKKTKVSKKGQKRVSKKIARLVGDEDKSQEQAAAIAYSMEERGELKKGGKHS